MERKDVRSFVTYWHTATNQSSEFTVVVVVANLGSLTGNSNNYLIVLDSMALPEEQRDAPSQWPYFFY